MPCALASCGASCPCPSLMDCSPDDRHQTLNSITLLHHRLLSMSIITRLSALKPIGNMTIVATGRGEQTDPREAQRIGSSRLRWRKEEPTTRRTGRGGSRRLWSSCSATPGHVVMPTEPHTLPRRLRPLMRSNTIPGHQAV